MTSKKPVPPEGLSSAGVAMWNDIVGSWDLRSDELRILKDACFEADIVDTLQRNLGELTVIGSQNQMVVNPLLPEIRQHRGVVSNLLKQLKLPDESDTSEARSSQAREAANARWHKRTG